MLQYILVFLFLVSLSAYLHLRTRPWQCKHLAQYTLSVESCDRWKGSVWLRLFHLWPYRQLSSQNSLHSPALYVQASSACLRRHHVSRPHNTGCRLIVAAYQQAYHHSGDETSLSVLGLLTMHLTQLNRECLLHLFSFLDKDSRRSLSLTCHQLREVFLDPRLWNLLHFSSPCQLRRDNFVLGPSLRYLTVCWYSSRVLQVCNIEDWLKSSFQKDICSKHESLVSTFLAHVCHTWVFVCVVLPCFVLCWDENWQNVSSGGGQPVQKSETISKTLVLLGPLQFTMLPAVKVLTHNLKYEHHRLKLNMSIFKLARCHFVHPCSCFSQDDAEIFNRSLRSHSFVLHIKQRSNFCPKRNVTSGQMCLKGW